MNKRIQEIVDQCSEWVHDSGEGHVKIDTEKLTELIVRECCDQLVKQGEGWQRFAKNPPKGQEHTASAALFAAFRLKEDAVWELKEHFGVE